MTTENNESTQEPQKPNGIPNGGPNGKPYDMPSFAEEENVNINTPNLLQRILLPALIGGAIAFLLISFMAPSKGAYREDITRLELDLVSARDRITATEQQISSLTDSFSNVDVTHGDLQAVTDTLSQWTTKVTDTQDDLTETDAILTALVNDIDNYARLSDLDNLDLASNDTLAQLATSLDELMISYEETVAKVAELEAEINELETEEEEENPVVTGNIKATVSTFAGMPITFQGISETDESAITVRVKITNEMNVRAENIQIVLVFQSNYTLPAFASGYPQLTSSIQWTPVSVSSNIMVFATSWGVAGINLDPGESKIIYPQLKVKADAGAGSTQTYYLSAEVSIETYD